MVLNGLAEKSAFPARLIGGDETGRRRAAPQRESDEDTPPSRSRFHSPKAPSPAIIDAWPSPSRSPLGIGPERSGSFRDDRVNQEIVSLSFLRFGGFIGPSGG